MEIIMDRWSYLHIINQLTQIKNENTGTKVENIMSFINTFYIEKSPELKKDQSSS